MTLNFNANWNKILVFILCILLVFNVVVGSSVTADASITLTASTIAVIGAALVACGFTFQNSAQISAVAENLWNNLTTEQQNFFINSGLTYLDYANSTEPFIIKLSKDICTAIGSWIGSLGATADSSSVSVPVDGSGFPLTITPSAVPFIRISSGSAGKAQLLEFIQTQGLVIGSISGATLKIAVSDYHGSKPSENGGSFSLFIDSPLFSSVTYGMSHFEAAECDSSFTIVPHAVSYKHYRNCFDLYDSSGAWVRNSSSLSDDVMSFILSEQSGAVSIPWTGDYAPSFGGTKELSDETDIVVPGGMVKDNELDDGVVSVMNPDSVRSADVPDVITGTGSIVGEGTGTGIFESIGKWILNIPILGDILKAIIEGFTGLIEFLQELLETIVMAISSAITSVIEFVRDLFIPKNFTWDNFINDVVKIVSPPASVDFRSFVNSTPIPDVTMELKGNTYTVVDNSYLRKNISTFRGIIGAFLAVLLVIYNYNMFMRLMGYSGFSFNDSRKNEKGGNVE